MNFIITNHTRVDHSVMAWNEFWLKQSSNNLGCPECGPKQIDLRVTSRFSRLTCSNEINIAVLSDPSHSSWQKLQRGSHSVHEFDVSCVFQPDCMAIHLYILFCLLYYLQCKCSFNVLSVFFNISNVYIWLKTVIYIQCILQFESCWYTYRRRKTLI